MNGAGVWRCDRSPIVHSRPAIRSSRARRPGCAGASGSARACRAGRGSPSSRGGPCRRGNRGRSRHASRSTCTSQPARANSSPAIIPAGPPPTMIRSKSDAMTSDLQSAGCQRVKSGVQRTRMTVRPAPALKPVWRRRVSLGGHGPQRRAGDPRRGGDRHPGLRAAQDLARSSASSWSASSSARIALGALAAATIRGSRRSRSAIRMRSSRSPSSASSSCCSRSGSTSASGGCGRCAERCSASARPNSPGCALLIGVRSARCWNAAVSRRLPLGPGAGPVVDRAGAADLGHRQPGRPGRLRDAAVRGSGAGADHLPARADRRPCRRCASLATNGRARRPRGRRDAGDSGGSCCRGLFAQAARTKSPELFLAISLLIVILASLATSAVGLSPILGALIAGILIAETEYHGEVEVITAPLPGLALGIFLITVGMSIDLAGADRATGRSSSAPLRRCCWPRRW